MTNNHNFFSIAVLISSLLFSPAVFSQNVHEFPASQEGAQQFVESVTNEIIVLLQEAKLNQDRDESVEKISEKFASVIDLKSAVKKIMGPAFSKSTSAQKYAFLKKINDSLIENYAQILLEFQIKSMKVTDVKYKKGKTPKALVQVFVVTSSLEAEIVYFLSYKKSGWKMYNFAFEGSDVTNVMRNIFLGAYLAADKDLDKVIEGWDQLMQASN